MVYEDIIRLMRTHMTIICDSAVDYCFTTLLCVYSWFMRTLFG